MSSNKLGQHIQQTYFLLRVGMALISFLFPLILWFAGSSLGINLQASISSYYHTPMRNVFVGFLFSLGTFLYFYKGYSNKENYALNFAGFFAICIALLPTSATEILKCETFTAPYLHGISASIFFLLIAFVCIATSSESLREIRSESKKRLFQNLYYLLGFLMIVLPLLSALLLHFLKNNQIIFFVELVAIWTFSAYWILKTIEFKDTQLDSKSLGR